MIVVATFLGWVRSTLLDTAKNGWSDGELISYLNGGMAQILAMRPNAIANFVDVTLVAGTLQKIPIEGTAFLDCYANAAGGPVTVQAPHEFIRTNPGWKTAAPGPTQYIIYDARVPDKFHVYPPAVAGTTLTIAYGPGLALLDTSSTVAEFPNYFSSALWAFVVGSALAKNTKRQDFAKTDFFMKLFTQFASSVSPTIAVVAARADPKGTS